MFLLVVPLNNLDPYGIHCLCCLIVFALRHVYATGDVFIDTYMIGLTMSVTLKLKAFECQTPDILLRFRLRLFSF